MQQHGSKYFACRPTKPQILKMGSIGQKSTFSEHGNDAYQIKGIHEILLQRPTPLALELRSKGQISAFSEHGHVAYQIKGNHKM